MAANRIQINGVWYVQEDTIKKEDVLEEIDPVHSQKLSFETGDYYWDATRIYRDDDWNFYDDIYIEFIDKTKPDGMSSEPECWDNNSWLRGVLDNNPESISEASLSMDKEGIRMFRSFLKVLRDRGWI